MFGYSFTKITHLNVHDIKPYFSLYKDSDHLQRLSVQLFVILWTSP